MGTRSRRNIAGHQTHVSQIERGKIGDLEGIKKITIQAYDPGWVDAFEQLALLIEDTLVGIPFQIEHVGSTSVRGLAAKPILDIDVIVTQEWIPTVIRWLGRIGYQHRGNLGIEGREAFYPPEDRETAHHLYVCAAGCAALRNHLLVRDWLRTHPKDAKRYGELKQDLAERFPNDINAYVGGKSAFIAEILLRTGMEASEIQVIEDSNRNLAK